MDIDGRIASLLRQIGSAVDHEFAGLGLIFYTSMDALPHLALSTPPHETTLKDARGEARVAEILVNVSALRSPWHDGFHFIRTHDFALTHIAQFVSPPIIAALGNRPIEGGARHVSASLSSEVDGISLTAVLPASGSGVLYERGQGTCIGGRERWGLL